MLDRSLHVASSPGHSQILSRSREEKLGEGLGSKLCHGLEMWTRFRNDGNVPMHIVAGIGQFNPPRCFVNSYGLRKYRVTNKRCVDISRRRFACTLTER